MAPLIPSFLQKIVPYEPGKPIDELQRELGLAEVVKLASNESPLGPPQASLDAMAEAIREVNYYPDDSYFYLKSRISEKYDVPMKNITIGAGSAELIVNAARALLRPDCYAVISEQTFVMYWLAVQSVNGNMIKVPLRHYTYDLRAMSEAVNPYVSLVYIANPNNPTGTIATAEEFDRFISSLPEGVTVVYDEAYREYIDDPSYPDPMKYFRQGKDIIILRTFSKVYGLAGMRIGYAIANDELTDALKRVRSPFNVSAVAAAGALAALDAESHVAKAVELNTGERNLLTRELQNMGLNVVPAFANFVLIDLGGDTRELNDKLLHRGIIVRRTASFGVPTGIRVTVGLPEENRKLIEVLKSVI